MIRSKSAKGVLGELAVASKYIRKGYWVAMSMCPQCPFDLVITNDKGESCLIDVKTLNKRRDGSRINRTTTKSQKKMGIEIYEVE